MKPILPGGVIGVLGSGQLGRMFAIAARRMGYRVHTYSPESDTPTGQVADREFTGSYENLAKVRQFARGVDVVTFEFENIPLKTVEAAATIVPVRPAGRVLHIAQHRLREKTYLKNSGFPVVPHRHIRSLADLRRALEELGVPAVLKTAGFGYDGKGQVKIKAKSDAVAAFATLQGQEAVLEAFIDYAGELSVIGARGLDGKIKLYPPILNEHANHILNVSVCPAPLPARVQKEAARIMTRLLKKMQVVGVLCAEFFLTKQGRLLINELAPRPHNSGHLTFDACVTSQFEQQLRAVCGLPLGSTELIRPAAMVNLLGDVWSKGEPRWAKALTRPDVKLHLYGKSAPRPGRKMGHITALAGSASQAKKSALSARAALR